MSNIVEIKSERKETPSQDKNCKMKAGSSICDDGKVKTDIDHGFKKLVVTNAQSVFHDDKTHDNKMHAIAVTHNTDINDGQISIPHRWETVQGMKRKLPSESAETKRIQLRKIYRLESSSGTNLRTLAPSVSGGIADYVEYVVCKICDNLFSEQKHLEKHVRLKHSDSKESRVGLMTLNVMDEKQTENIRGQCKQCKYCLTLVSAATLQQHEENCYCRKGWTCTFCSKHFSDKYSLKKHQQSCSARNKQCTFCLAWFPAATIQQHKQNCRKGGTACTLCAKGFFDKYSLKTHQQLCSTRSKQCKSCLCWFSAATFQQHEQNCCSFLDKKGSPGSVNCDIVSSDKYKQCHFCLEWVSSGLFKQHELKCTEKAGAACQYCSKWFSKKYLEMHQQLCKQQVEPEKAQCKSCGTWCVSDVGLARHARLFCKERNKLQKQTIRGKCKTFETNKCRSCDQLFKIAKLKTHEHSCIRKCQSNRCAGHGLLALLNRRPPTFLPDKKCRCRSCDQLLTISKLKTHEQSCIRKCQSCKKWFTAVGIKIHELSCTKKERKCRFCLKLFTTQLHVFDQHEQKCKQQQVQCTFCFKSVPAALSKIHKLTCTEKSLTCKFCLNLVSASVLNEHKVMCQKKHGVACKICKQMISKTELMMHERWCEKLRKRNNGNVEFCGELVIFSEPERHNLIHETECKMHEESGTKLTDCRFCKKQISQSVLDIHEQSCEDMWKQKRGKCRYRGEWLLFSWGILRKHELTCEQKKDVLCKICSRSVPVRELNMHEQSCQNHKCRYGPSSIAQSDLKVHKNPCAALSSENFCAAQSSRHNHQRVSFKPCHTCNGLFKLGEFQHHTCKRQGTSDQKDLLGTLPQLPASDNWALEISPLNVDNISSPIKINHEESDVYMPQFKVETEMNSLQVNREWYTAGNINETVAEIKTENLCEIETDKVSSNDTRGDVKDDPDVSHLLQTGDILDIKSEPYTDIQQICGMGNISVIKPENESNISQLCQTEMSGIVLVIKPTDETDMPEHCSDFPQCNLPGTKSKSEAEGNINPGDGTFSLKSEPSELYGD